MKVKDLKEWLSHINDDAIVGTIYNGVPERICEPRIITRLGMATNDIILFTESMLTDKKINEIVKLTRDSES